MNNPYTLSYIIDKIKRLETVCSILLLWIAVLTVILIYHIVN